MATTERASWRDHTVPITVLRRARFYAAQRVMELLDDVANTDELALLLDVDALQRTTRARIDRVMTLALEMLADSGVRIVITARDEVEGVRVLQRILVGCCFMADVASCVHIHDALPGRLVAVTDDDALLRALRPDDVGIALGTTSHEAPNTTRTDDAALRAALWWLVDRRVKPLSPKRR